MSNRGKSKGTRWLAYVLAALPWLAVFGIVRIYENSVRAAKNIKDYTGLCYKPNGYEVKCTLEQWLVWDATPVREFILLIGCVLAAAISAGILLRFGLIPKALLDQAIAASKRNK